MNSEIEPLVPADVDLKGFPGFMLDAEALLASELVALATPEEIAAALMLWCRAWQQVPHGSLPNDERVLAAFSKAKNWKKVRDMALRGFVLCSDGRLYHKTLCIKVMDAWGQRLAYQSKRKKDADRLAEWRDKKRTKNETGNAPGNDDGNDSGNAGETRFETQLKPLRSEVKGSEAKGSEVTPNSVPNGTGAAAPKTPDEMTKTELWAAGKSLLLVAGMPEAQCGSFVGKLVKDYTSDLVVQAVRIAVVEQPADPASFLKATCQRLAGERRPGVGQPIDLDAARRAANEEARRRLGLDDNSAGVIDAQ